MKKSLVYLSMLLICNIVLSQSPAYIESLKNYQTHYNSGNHQAVYGLFDETMKKSISLEQISAIDESFMDSFGNIERFSFVEKKISVEKYIVHYINGKQYVLLSLNTDFEINGLLFQPYQPNVPGKFDRNSTSFQLPFKGEWFTFWGGTDKRQNYHVINKTQKGAFDFIILGKNNRSYQRSGTRNEDYYAFGKPLYAVCDAEVYQVIKGIPDNRPSQMNPKQALGNAIILKTANDEYIVYAHFEDETIRVKKGDRVVQGQYLGNCGNSGNSSEPHLHLHIQDGPNLFAAAGARSFFEELIVNGKPEKDYSPVKGDRISRIKQ